MPGSKRQRTDLKTSIQQRQEQQRARPTSTAKTSGGGVGGQQSGSTGQQPVHLRLEPTPAPPAWPGEPLKVGAIWHEPRPSAFEVPPPAPFVDFSTAHTLLAPTPAQVGEEVERPLAPLPRRGEALTLVQEAALELMTDLARDLAIHAHHSHLDELIRRIPELGTACGRAVANALREAR